MKQNLERKKEQDLPNNSCDGNYKVTTNYDCMGGDIIAIPNHGGDHGICAGMCDAEKKCKGTFR